MTTIYDLPQPLIKAQERSFALQEIIRSKINEQADRLISFADYMKIALYHPKLGYYCSPDFALGKTGDFTTAPEISSLFGSCLAKQLAQVMTDNHLQVIYELGAGSGKLALDILTELHRLEKLPQHYFIYEISLALREKQQLYLRTHCPQWFDRITWLDVFPSSYSGIVIANEVLDALPVSCFEVSADNVAERCVGLENNEFVWRLNSTKTPALLFEAEKMRENYELYSGYRSEINLQLNDFLESIAGNLVKGVIFFIDYGYGENEYYHPQRSKGTLTCFYQHYKHDNPLLWPGLQDITAHVNFTRVIDIAYDLHCSLAGFTTQASFLFSCGLMDFAAEQSSNKSESDVFVINQAIKILTMPTEMGERIKVMALSKEINLPLMGFTMQDRRREL